MAYFLERIAVTIPVNNFLTSLVITRWKERGASYQLLEDRSVRMNMLTTLLIRWIIAISYTSDIAVVNAEEIVSWSWYMGVDLAKL